ncbi:MAG: peptide-methionine (S)-S-oxide reductase MsrA [Vicinamibacteria bacterium]
MNMSRTLTTIIGVCAVASAVALSGGLTGTALSAEKVRLAPAPIVDLSSTPSSTSETAVFAAGCFWGVQGVFQHVKGVTGAISGYAGGEKTTAEYETVGSGRTGHAESVLVTFDPRVVTYGRLLQILFSVVHDPTQLNRQGPDSGSQYRSAIFPSNAEQAKVAEAYLGQLTAAHVFKSAIVTKIELARPFYRAEDYHQDYLTLNPMAPYIAINDLPKVDALKKFFPEVYREKPVLVGSYR